MTWSVRVEEGRAALAASGAPYVQPFTHGTMRCVLFQPDGIDVQTPHTQDELYLITRGKGSFTRGDERIAYAPGDLIFVAAGMAHRFEDFSKDLECWAVFWGPKGGEA